jgi:hypothetical protein
MALSPLWANNTAGAPWLNLNRAPQSGLGVVGRRLSLAVKIWNRRKQDRPDFDFAVVIHVTTDKLIYNQERMIPITGQ